MKLEKLRAWILTLLELVRVRNAAIAFFGVFVGSMLSPYGAPLLVVLTAGLSAALILAGGNAINDYFDVEIDRVNKPRRPIPSGRMNSSDTLMIALILFFSGVGMAKHINTYCLAIAAFNSVLLILYAKYSKKLLFIANLAVSYLVASVFVYGAAATLNAPVMEPAKFTMIYILAACSFFMTLSREVVKDMEDIEGDRRQYSYTLPILIGAENARRVAIAFGAMAILSSILPFLSNAAPFRIILYAPIIAIADIIFIFSFTLKPEKSQKIMVVGMVLSLIAFMAGATA